MEYKELKNSYMCNFRKKKELFQYFVRKVVGRFLDINEDFQLKIEVPEDFTNTKFMKLLYCLCLESYGEDTPSMELFDVFNNMKAYPRGPLEVDIYNSLSTIDGLKYEDGRITEIAISEVIEQNEHYLIDHAVERLVERKLLSKSADALIDITHQLPIWNETYNYVDDKRMKINFFSLEREWNAYKNLFRN